MRGLGALLWAAPLLGSLVWGEAGIAGAEVLPRGLEDPRLQRDEERVFRREVAIERRRGVAQLVGQARQREPLQTVACEELDRGIEDALHGQLAPAPQAPLAAALGGLGSLARHAEATGKRRVLSARESRLAGSVGSPAQ